VSFFGNPAVVPCLSWRANQYQPEEPFCLVWARPAESESEVDVFPVPPFCEVIAIVIFELNLPKANLDYFGRISCY
jgi:hypothetical protein